MVKGIGGVNLILFEKDQWMSKLRFAFDSLPKDFTGRASRGNVLDLLNDTKSNIVKFLAGIHDPMNEYVIRFLDIVISFAEANAWPMVTFDEFKIFLNRGDGMDEEKKKIKEGKEEEGKE